MIPNLRPLALLLVLPFCTALADGVADAIEITSPYARAVPSGQPNSAVFMALGNPLAAEHALVAAESPAADVVELHTHRMEGSMMRMRRIERIPLPAGAAVSLQPGGLHVMLIGLKRQLVPGDEVVVDLVFDDGSRRQITAPVREIQPPRHQGGAGHGAMHHGKATASE